jgi:Zn-dependent peptidase ImmA (M78 family)
MPRFIPDPVGGLPWRPYKSADEIDAECECLLRQFLALLLLAPMPLPLTTDLFTVMIEEHAQQLDLYADLHENVEGLTTISSTTRPTVRINRQLSATPARVNRLRSTLAHELYHVVFHAPYYQEQCKQGGLFTNAAPQITCSRNTILTPKKVDWREWQAAYGAGALLMPRTALHQMIRDHSDVYGLPSYAEASQEAEAIITLIATSFAVSHEAAAVRLRQRGVIQAGADGPQLGLFD